MQLSNSHLVDVVMVTYNHEPFISQAIESVLSQKCKFQFRLIIGEDCSRDKTAEICRSYSEKFPLKILFYSNEKNLGLIRNYQKVFSYCTSEYAAILEGDDYWTDDLKLEKQVEILENNNEIGLVSTGLDVLYPNGKIKRAHIFRNRFYREGYYYASFLKGTYYKPSSITVCFRYQLMKEYFDFNYFVEHDFKTLDAPLWFELAYHSKFAHIPDITAIYRILNDSVSNNRDALKVESFLNTSKATLEYYIRKYPVKGLNEKKIITRINYLLTILYLKNHLIEKARFTSDEMRLFRLKYIFIWLIANNNFLKPVFDFYLFLLKSSSDLKQKLFMTF